VRLERCIEIAVRIVHGPVRHLPLSFLSAI
jgi:hypothetical protein